MKFAIIPLLFSILLFSCGTQKRLSQAKEAARLAKEDVVTEMRVLDSVNRITQEKLKEGEMDSTIKSEYEKVLSHLVLNLRQVEQRITGLEQFLENKSNFRNKSYERNVQPYLNNLDSFNVLKQERDMVYKLVTEAVSMKAFSLFQMAAFFEPGVYRIPPAGLAAVRKSYLPILDSVQYLANKYGDIPRTVRLVFVGYADESPIAEGSTLYNELARYTHKENPSNIDLNRVLSQLRANEMMQNMRFLVQEKFSSFNSSASLKINYYNYGLGEQYPNPNIKNYQQNDERRRIVMFYWSVLPNLK